MGVPRQPVDIALGGKTLTIRPLTFAQVEAIESAMDAKLGSVAQGRRIIIAGLSRDHRNVADEVERGEMEVDVREISEAMVIILRQGGFLPSAPGEAGAAAPNASAGLGSEAG